jgi:uncharacterized protein
VIAIVSDTHMPRGSRSLPTGCLELVAEASLLIHAGDFTGSEILDELERHAAVAAVHGNMDEHALRRRLPATAIVEAEGLRIGVIHDGGPAAGREERLRTTFAGCDLIVYGHSHLPEVSRSEDVWIVNPGSPTERRRAPWHTMAVVREGVPDLVHLS